jgi:hypothetical protein
LSLLPNESIGELPKNSVHCPAVDVDVSARKVTEGFVYSPRHGLKYIPRVGLIHELLPTHYQSQFEGHIETRCAGSVSIELNPRQVVEGKVALLN